MRYLSVFVLAAMLLPVYGADVTLQWDPSDRADSYMLYYRDHALAGQTYDTAHTDDRWVDAGNPCTDTDTDGIIDTCEYQWTNVPDVDRLYFVATASNTAGESGNSNEVYSDSTAPGTPGSVRVTVHVGVVVTP